MTKIKMSIEWDNSITEVSDTDKTNCEYCEINITNTFKKFAMSLGGEHLWYKIVDKIATDHGYKKPDYNKTANEPIPEDYRKKFLNDLNKTELNSEQAANTFNNNEEGWRISPEALKEIK